MPLTAPRTVPYPEDPGAEARRSLHSAGLRSTTPRVAVLGLLMQAERPLSHSEVVEALGVERWDQATLYRNLVKLVEARLARIASEVNGVRRYELIRDEHDACTPHPHFVCVCCGAVTCLPQAHLVSDPPLSVDALEIQVRGRCEACR